MKYLTTCIFSIICLNLSSQSNVGIGTTTPQEKLDVNGNIRMSGEIKPNGAAGEINQVLTSNGNGTMQWSSMQSNQSDGSGAGPWDNWCTDNVINYQPIGDPTGSTGDIFGHSVSISSDYAVIGAYEDDENGFSGTGSASIYKWNSNSSSWEYMTKLLNQNASGGDQFGYSVCIKNDKLIIGARLDNEGFTDNGSASIYERNANTGVWEFKIKLINQSTTSLDYFGTSVSIDGNYAIVGANGDDTGGELFGSASIYEKNLTTGIWEFKVKLQNPSPASGDNFGSSVSINGNYCIIGSPTDTEAGFSQTGSATIFKRNTTTGNWESQGKIINVSPAADDHFGSSVSISENYAIVGAPLDDEGFTENGSATIFKRNVTTSVWQSQQKLINNSTSAYDWTGSSVSISNDILIFSSLGDNDESGNSQSGSCSIYRKYGNTWKSIQLFYDPSGSPNDSFGRSVSIDGQTRKFIIGAAGIQTSMGLSFFGKVR
jgi:hypothetical protein